MQRIFREVNYSDNVILHLSKPTEYISPKANPNVNYELRVTMCQCSFIYYNKRVPLVGVLIMGEAEHVWGQEVHGTSLYFLLSFAMNLKLL